ncbi:MAG TPA: UrcA family protein [Parvularculaceae bacterium]|nr:UrcA family protein [Parvularculaceae bacterium]HNS85866.1 UrcA family protein [Parvularculaceae bacterium]
MKSLAIAFISAAVLALAASPAFAGDVEFAYSRDDLASSARIAALYERIEEKADRACNVYQNSGLFAVDYKKACAEAVTAELVSGVDNERLTALHEAQHGDRLATSR